MNTQDDLSDAIVDGDIDRSRQLVVRALSEKTDPLEVFNSLSRGIGIVGECFGKGELFLFDLMRAAEAMKGAMAVLEPRLMEQKRQIQTLGTFVIGTVAGDIHDIGKNIVAVMLAVAGFDVTDLGVDVKAQIFVEKAREKKADIVGISALMSPTLPEQRNVIDSLGRSTLRNRIKVMIGGAVVTERWAREIGADSYATDAVNAVSRAKELLVQH